MNVQRVIRGMLVAGVVCMCAFLLCSCCEHVYIETVREPTCTEAGCIVHTCEKCGASYESDPVEALGHRYPTDAPACRAQTCLECGQVQPPTAAHRYESVTVEPTCTAGGYTMHTCMVCGDVYTDTPVPPRGHVYDSDNPCYLRTCIYCKDRIMPSHDDELVRLIRAATIATPGSGIFACNNCHREVEQEIPCIMPGELGLPILELTGSMSGMSKENEVALDLRYTSPTLNFACVALMKWQGASSVGFPKKNYTIKLYRDDTLAKKQKIDPFGWGAESKYCLKANYVDFSQSRNVVSGRLFGDVVRSRSELDPNLRLLTNGGAIDGYPVIVYLNGDYLGFYTMNIPKDEWLFGMTEEGEDVRQAILFSNDWTASGALDEAVRYDFSNGWDLEYCSTVDSTWVVDSFNRLIDFVDRYRYDTQGFRAGIGEYLDVEATIDTMIMVYVSCARDNSSKNTLWVTYDGVKWIPSIYDMDGTYGLFWNGQVFNAPTDMLPSVANGGSVNTAVYNVLWEAIFRHYRAEVKARYFELREGALSMENITRRFDGFFDSVPDVLYESERERWPSVPSQTTNNRAQILDFTESRLVYLDAFFGAL